VLRILDALESGQPVEAESVETLPTPGKVKE
jgi:hypothetical protein